MAGAEGIVFALRALGEAGQAAALAQGAHAVAAPGEDLVRIGLVTDVPDQSIGRGVVDMVQRYGQFDDAQGRAEMTAGHRGDFDQFLADLVGQLTEILRAQGTEIRRAVDPIQ